MDFILPIWNRILDSITSRIGRFFVALDETMSLAV